MFPGPPVGFGQIQRGFEQGPGVGLVGGDRGGAGDDQRDTRADAGDAGLLGGGDVAAGLVGVPGVDRGFDQIQDHPSPRDAGAGNAEGVDLGDLQMGLIEVALAGGREVSSRLGVGPSNLDAAWRGPGRGLLAPGQGEVHVAAKSRA